MKYRLLYGFMLFFLLACLPVQAKEAEPMSFQFELSVDGQNTKNVNTGDIITVVLKLRRLDAAKPYTMHGMQAEIRYDATFFELVEGSEILYPGVVATDIAMVDRHREFYMNFLSVGGGTTWEDSVVVGSFQLKVLGETGTSNIRIQESLVSLPDGSGSYTSETEETGEVLAILSTGCSVTFDANGGTPVAEQKVQFGEKIIAPLEVSREGFTLEGWYRDIHLTDKWDFEKDVVEGNMTLYAKWTVVDAVDGSDSNVPVDAKTGDGSNVVLWIVLVAVVGLALVWIIYTKKKKDKL